MRTLAWVMSAPRDKYYNVFVARSGKKVAQDWSMSFLCLCYHHEYGTYIFIFVQGWQSSPELNYFNLYVTDPRPNLDHNSYNPLQSFVDDHAWL